MTSIPDERQALAGQIVDLRAERDELAGLLRNLQASDWERETAFRGWRVWDVIAHLHLSDHMGITSLEGEEPFRALMREMRDADVPMAVFARRWIGDIPGAELRERWHALLTQLGDQLAQCDPERRLPWGGPSMKPRMFATARQMETWAHGWELYDLLRIQRPATDRLRNVATIGVRTFGWTFANRKLDLPGPAPRVELRAPSGELWAWNESNVEELVRGDAVEFCQVVTQVRNVADTRLRIVGPVASRWMAIAQCFAGPAVDPPAPGTCVPRG